MSMSEAIKEVLLIHKLNVSVGPKTKHFAIRYLFSREHVQRPGLAV